MRSLIAYFMALLIAVSAFAGDYTVFDISSPSVWDGDADGYQSSVNIEGAAFYLSYERGQCGFDLMSPVANSFSWRVYKGSSFSITSPNVSMSKIIIQLDSYENGLYIGEGVPSSGWQDSLDSDSGIYSFESVGLPEFHFTADRQQIRIKSIIVTGDITGDIPDQVIYENKFDRDLEGWALINDYTLSDFRGWKINSNYPKCAICSSFYGNENHPAHSIMEYTVDLSGYNSCRMSVAQAFGFFFPYAQVDNFRLYVRYGDETKYLDFLNFPPEPETGNWSNSFANNQFDLSEFDGETITIGFEYETDGSESRAWELKNFRIEGTKIGTAVTLSEPGLRSDRQYFTLSGLAVERPQRGMYILKQGSKVRKIILR